MVKEVVWTSVAGVEGAVVAGVEERVVDVVGRAEPVMEVTFWCRWAPMMGRFYSIKSRKGTGYVLPV